MALIGGRTAAGRAGARRAGPARRAAARAAAPRSVRGLLTLAATAAALAPAAQAQDPRRVLDRDPAPSPNLAPPAWIGILTDEATLPWNAGAFALRVTAVHSTGPAREGGLLPGDLLVTADGAALASSEHWLNILANLLPGSELRLGVVRGEVSMERGVVAAPHPGPFPAPADLARLDTLQDRIARRVDSIFQRVALGAASPDSGAAAGFLNAGQRLRAAETRIQVRWRMSAGGTTETDSLLAEDRARARELERIADESQSPPVAGGGAAAVSHPDDAVAARALTPLMLQRQVVLGGIQVRDLDARLGHYFGVEAGALATDVVPGSAAARAGFRAGDVIVAVGGQPVGAVTQLRAALATAARPITVAVVRERVVRELIYPPGSRWQP